jgi:DNA-binding transcriptional LysR family regulator
MVVVARHKHPRVKATLDLDGYLAEQHVQLSGRRAGPSFEDIELSRLGIARNVRLRCQNAYAAFSIVNETDLLLTIAESYALELSRQFDNQILPLPLETPPFDAYLYWHDNVDNDPGNRWLRQQLEGIMGSGVR